MLSHRLSKILAEKNVPHEGDKWWGEDITHGKFTLLNSNRDSMWVNYIPAYPEITLFKYAKVLWTGKDHCAECGVVGNMHYIETDHRGFKTDSQHHTHTLADLFSSGASLETIENYVLESLKIS